MLSGELARGEEDTAEGPTEKEARIRLNRQKLFIACKIEVERPEEDRNPMRHKRGDRRRD